MDKLLGALSSAFNLDDESINQFKDENGAWLGEDDLSTKVADVLKSRLDAYGQAKIDETTRRERAAFEKWAKKTGYQNTAGLRGEQLFDALREHFEASGAGNNPDALTKEQLAKLPAFKEVLSEQMGTARAEHERLKSEFDQYKAQATREKVQTVVREQAAAALREGRIRLNVEGVDETARLEVIYSALEKQEIGLDETGKPVLMKDGDVLVDSWGKPVSFSKYVTTFGEKLFGKDDFDPSKGSPSPGKDGKQAQPGNKWNFKTQADVDAYLSRETDPAKAAEAQKAWFAQLDSDN